MTPLFSVVSAFLASRTLCSLLVYFGHTKRPYLQPALDGWEGINQFWLNPWTPFDTQWYIDIATNGYQAHSTSFFPLYPWLISLAGTNPVHMATLGVLISHLALLVALWLLFQLTKHEWGEGHAHTTVWLLAFSPAAPFFGAAYTESLFLALTAGTFLSVRQQRWWLAGGLGMLAALLRNPGFLIAAALAWEAWDQHRQYHSGQWAAWMLPLGGFLAVQAWFWLNFGGPLAGISSQEFYHRHLAWPWQPLIGDLSALLSGRRSLIFNLTAGAGLIASAAGLYLATTGWRNFKISYLLLIGGITLMNLCMMRQLPPHTISAVRYMGGLFPVAQICAWYLIEKLAGWPKTRMLLVGLQLYLFIVFSYLFGLKQFLG